MVDSPDEKTDRPSDGAAPRQLPWRSMNKKKAATLSVAAS